MGLALGFHASVESDLRSVSYPSSHYQDYCRKCRRLLHVLSNGNDPTRTILLRSRIWGVHHLMVFDGETNGIPYWPSRTKIEVRSKAGTGGQCRKGSARTIGVS